MCGIAGEIDLSGRREIDRARLARMAGAILHRGPDEEGFLIAPGVGLANRRLSIVGLADGQQPIWNEDRTIGVVFNGELFDYPEKKAWLASKGHKFRTSCDTELFVHLYEEFGDGLTEHLKGQFAFAIWDSRKRRVLLGRDRLGICPLFWARRGDTLWFGSEIKAILAGGGVKAEADERGINHIFTFFAMATRRTAFRDVHAVLPGHTLAIDFRSDGRPADPVERQYWDLDFAAQGQEEDPPEAELLERFERHFHRAVEIRLRADVPVVSYLSGGVDSTTVATVAGRLRGGPIPTFTIKIDSPQLDETDRALMAARVIGAPPTIVTCGSREISNAYPKLVQAAEAPVMDTSCAALYCLAEEVHRQGYKVAVTGEGADEALAGYPWFKTNRLMQILDAGSFRPSMLFRRLYTRFAAPQVPWARVAANIQRMGGQHAIMDLYGLVALSRFKFYTPGMFERIGDHIAYDDLTMPLERMKKWHPLNKSLYLGYKLMLPGLLMNHKGDRPAMANSVETRYPFLDEDFVDFCAGIHPKWKLRGLTRDKHLLRQFARRILPTEIADRPKAMFRAPFANTFFDDPPGFVDQLLSTDSLKRTGYFDADKVTAARAGYHKHGWSSGRRLTLEMGLTGVMATQLWHHQFLGGGLCELPSWQPPS
jgi:asparagine synthase (glutamine-hydrolysing)